MKFRPCIDLHQGRVKQIVGGTLDNNEHELVENFVADKDASYFAEIFKRDQLTGGHIIMLGPGNQEQAVKALEAYPGGMQVGGGITADNAEFYLNHGAAHVIVTSYVFRDGEIYEDNLYRLQSRVGKEKLVLDLSCRKNDGTYYVVTDRWQKFTRYEINEINLKALAQYCDEFLIHAVDVEGKCSGIQGDLIEKLGRWVSIPATYAGGVGTMDDIRLARKLGRDRIDLTIGSALDLYGGSLSYSDVVNYFVGDS